MHVFEFKDYTAQVQIAGTTFSVNCTAELGDKLGAISEELSALGEAIEKREKTPEDAIAGCKTVIDGILGDHAFEAIFTGRKPTVTDCSDVCLFIIDEITDFLKSLSKKQTKETRRTANKK